MKNQSLVITTVITLLMHSFSYADILEDSLKLSSKAYKDVIYEALKEDKKLGPHIPKTVKEQRQEKLKICKFWLDQYDQLTTERNEAKTMESCTAAGIDMSKYQTQERN
jgi:hypothetical protein